jgi:hypothetical protein
MLAVRVEMVRLERSPEVVVAVAVLPMVISQ